MKARRYQLIAGIVAALVLAGLIGLYVSYRVQLQPAQPNDQSTQTFQITAGQSAPTIAQNLVDAQLIKSRQAFVTYINLHGLRPKLKAGTYELSPSWAVPQIAQLIAGGRTLTQRVVIPEGYTLKQIRAAVVAAGLSGTEFDAALKAPHTQTVVSGRPSGVSLEGYLFPDSYEIGATTTAASLVNTMIDNLAAKTVATYTPAFTAQGLTYHQGLTLASIVEREVNIPADRPVVAQIFLKRLRSGQTLGSDVTTEYAAQLRGVPFDVNLDSPYNTRVTAGLPPGPICSPGTSAMDAVAKPATTDYLYFLSGTDGKTYFAKTYAEHQQNIAKHLR